MFDILLESGAKKKISVGQTVFSVITHVVLIYGAIQTTKGATSIVRGMITDTSMMFLTPPPPPPPPPPPTDIPPPVIVATTAPPPQGFQTVMPPTEIPTTIPPINLAERFDKNDFSGKGVEGGIATGVIGGTGVVPTNTATVTGETFLDSQVDDPVREINGRQGPGPVIPVGRGVTRKPGKVERSHDKALFVYAVHYRDVVKTDYANSGIL